MPTCHLAHHVVGRHGHVFFGVISHDHHVDSVCHTIHDAEHMHLPGHAVRHHAQDMPARSSRLQCNRLKNRCRRDLARADVVAVHAHDIGMYIAMPSPCPTIAAPLTPAGIVAWTFPPCASPGIRARLSGCPARPGPRHGQRRTATLQRLLQRQTPSNALAGITHFFAPYPTHAQLEDAGRSSARPRPCSYIQQDIARANCHARAAGMQPSACRPKASEAANCILCVRRCQLWGKGSAG